MVLIQYRVVLNTLFHNKLFNDELYHEVSSVAECFLKVINNIEYETVINISINNETIKKIFDFFITGA